MPRSLLTDSGTSSRSSHVHGSVRRTTVRSAVALLATDPTTSPTTGPVRFAQDTVLAFLWSKQVRLLMLDYPFDSVMVYRVLGQGHAYPLTQCGTGASVSHSPKHARRCMRPHRHLPRAVRALQWRSLPPSRTRGRRQGRRVGAAHGRPDRHQRLEVDLPLWADAAQYGPCHPGRDSHSPSRRAVITGPRPPAGALRRTPG